MDWLNPHSTVLQTCLAMAKGLMELLIEQKKKKTLSSLRLWVPLLLLLQMANLNSSRCLASVARPRPQAPQTASSQTVNMSPQAVTVTISSQTVNMSPQAVTMAMSPQT